MNDEDAEDLLIHTERLTCGLLSETPERQLRGGDPQWLSPHAWRSPRAR